VAGIRDALTLMNKYMVNINIPLLLTGWFSVYLLMNRPKTRKPLLKKELSYLYYIRN
jgi:hypothetical protein